MSASTASLAPGRSLAWLWRFLLLLVLSTSGVGCAGLPANVQRTPSRAFNAPDQTALGQLAQNRRAQARARSDSGFTLLDSVDAAFSSRLALIDRAQRSLDLQYYAVHADASTAVLLERMKAAAQRGVRVRILLDDFNTVGEDAQVLRLAFIPGIEVRLFNPVPGSRGSLLGRVLGSLHDVEGMQKRMHNKLFIADNAWGITGGRNLGDAYFGDDDKSNFVDLDVLATGRIVRDMSASFDRYWNDELAYPVQSLLDKDDLERLRKDPPATADPARPAASAQHASLTPASTVLPNVTATDVVSAERPPMDLQRVPLTWAPSLLMADKPGKIAPGDEEANAGETVVDGLLQLMQRAQRELLIVSPYFVPGDAMMRQFADMRRRGIAVRVLTNSLASNDAPAAHAGYRRYRRDLLAMGVELYEMRADPASAGLQGSGSTRGGSSSKGGSGGSGGSGLSMGSTVGGSKSGASRASLHSKAVIIDRQLSVIGSMNLDLRSQLKNSEVALVIRSPALAQASAGLIERSFAHGAYRLELAEGGGLRWRAPPGAPFPDTTSEPEAPFKLRALVNLLAPFAPDEML